MINNTSDEKETQTEALIRLTEEEVFFLDQDGNSYSKFIEEGLTKVLQIDTDEYHHHLRKLYIEDKDKPISEYQITSTVDNLKTIAFYSGIIKKMHLRVAGINGNFYYDLHDEDRRAIKISKEGVEKVASPENFIRNNILLPQVMPDLKAQPKELIYLIKNNFNLSSEGDVILVTIYIVTSLIPNCIHPILVLIGTQGSGKSTALKKISRIVDPNHVEVVDMPSNKKDLVLSLKYRYLSCYDNVGKISNETSDLLSQAVTGSAILERALFTNNKPNIIKLITKPIAMNGINLSTLKEDFLDRSVVIELKRIPQTSRITEDEIWKAFKKDRPQILGACINTLHQAIKVYDSVKIEKLFRLSDFTRWGFAIAEVLKIGGKRFIDVYGLNSQHLDYEIVNSHPTARALISFMENRKEYVGSVSSLYNELVKVAEKEDIDTSSKEFPGAPNILSRRLREFKSNIEVKGITYEIVNIGDYKEIRITNSKYEEPVSEDSNEKVDVFMEDDHIPI